MKRTPLVRAAAPLGAVLAMSAIAGVIVIAAALAFLPSWYDPGTSRLAHSLGALRRPVTVGVWVLLAWTLLVVAFELVKARGRVALLYGVERGDDVWVGTWLGSWGLGRRRLACAADVVLGIGREPSVNPNGISYHAILVRSDGRSFTARSLAPPTQESVAHASRWLAEHGRSVTLLSSPPTSAG